MTGPRSKEAILSVFEPLGGGGGLARVGNMQIEALRSLGYSVQVVSPEQVRRPWRSRRYPTMNIALISWQISVLARSASRGGRILFSHGTCGAVGSGGPQVQLFHGTWAALADACKKRMSRLEHLILGHYTGLLEQWSGRRARCVAVSAGVAQETASFYRLPGTQVIYNAIPFESFSNASEPSRGDGEWAGLCVGRLDYGKGSHLVRDLGRLLPQDCRLLVASPEVRGDVHWPDARLTLLGAVPYADLPAVYRRADYLLCPSRYEGFGLTLIEAWASGRPVIAANVGIVPELRRLEPSLDQLVVDDPDDAAGFAERVQLLRDNPDLGRRQAAWGRDLVRSRFSTEAYRAAWRELLADYS